ncbi:hypothetical protein L195_g015449 [Trifolium pratense]|uniref:Uncharacterized protein n=2 Tax=Trifolium pratense TaxID=57577 RepID=A0ACB0KW03_TRIPR|nr:uncharacterized protein LOC123899761 [Trifolium pratense]XP_045807136.1 uncharacterized protein LOC123899915 [Trifolium pratense]PNX92315.1 hypothetical protein L195_g015449 [Trifolium pratense]CAJ2660063.1 unnamed protein product [Trifolium pratense]
MDNQPNSLLNWAYFCQGKSMEDLRQSLLYTTLELEQTRTLAQEELNKKDEQLMNLKDLINNIIRERDEAQEKCQRLLLEKLVFHQQQNAPLSGVSSIEDEPRKRTTIDSSNNGFSLSSSDCEESIVSSPIIDQSMIEVLTPNKPLPEKGKLLQAVMKAGPLLQTLLLAGPLPQWKHPPPPLESFQIPPVTIPQILHQDSIFSSNIDTTNSDSHCGRVSRKRVFFDDSDSPNNQNKYQRVVLH